VPGRSFVADGRQLAQSKSGNITLPLGFFIPTRKTESKKCIWFVLQREYRITAKIVNRTAGTSLGAEAAGGCTFRLFDFLGCQHARSLAIQYTVRHNLLLSVPQGLLDEKPPCIANPFLISDSVLDPNQERSKPGNYLDP
jgi:hypothetical protein